MESKGLEVLERLRKSNKDLLENNIILPELYSAFELELNTIEKELQAFNIIKKYIDVEFFFEIYEITPEARDLLREVLL